ncbi:MAG: hypothetical protein KAY37_11345 [Phycisphaerae bacterium]|nr:hypothetical protein [Phycisphaerae bacterium]
MQSGNRIRPRGLAWVLILVVGAVCHWTPGAQADEPIYVSIVMHNEEPLSGLYPDFVNDPPAFWQHRDALVQFVNMLFDHGVMFNYESDWNFLQAAQMYDNGTPSTNGKNIVRYIKEDLGFEVDPHAHESQYNYADVAYLIQGLGVTPSHTVGGFRAFPPEVSKLEYLWQPLTSTLNPAFTWEPQILWGGATMLHQNEQSLWISGVWKPKDRYNFLIHDEAAPLPYIGGYGRGWDKLHDLLQMQQSGELEEGRIYTCTVFAPQNRIVTPGYTPQFAQQIQAHDAAGDIQWVGLAEVINIWQTQYNSQPNILRWRTFGDADEDGDVDPADFAAFEGCVTGPGDGPISPDCYAFDREPDNDVDLADFSLFQTSFTGPEP